MDLFIILFVYFIFCAVVMASGNLNSGTNGPEVSANQQTENGATDYPSQDSDVQDCENHRCSTLNLSIDSETSSAELSLLHSDTESRFV